MLVRDLATTLLFLAVFLKSHSEELRAAGKKKKNVEEEEEGEGGGEGSRTCMPCKSDDTSSNINALFVAVADIFHCWFSSPVRH